MVRCSALLVVLLCAVGCGGSRTPPATAIEPSATGGSKRESKAIASVPVASSDTQSAFPPTLLADTSQLEADSLAERRLAADSAADEAVLEELADARPAAEPSDSAVPSDEAKALANAVTWDIDVQTFADHDRVQYYLDFFGTKGRERMGIWLNRMTRYEGMIRERLLKENLPADLVYLALIESGFSNAATSRAKAVGMWQFMKGTAKHYDLRIDTWVDERRDPFLATDAAARHLRDLTQRFGSVYLAAAAYNAGAGRVSRGLVRLPEDEEADPLESDATFFRLYDTKLLHRETKDYVPKLIAAALIAKQPARYGFKIDTTAPTAYDSVLVPDMTGLDVIARLADTTVAAIRELNPKYLRLATPPGARSVVRLPLGRGASTAGAYAALPVRQRISFVEHQVRRGETLSGIAVRYGVSVNDLATANPKIGKRRQVRSGQHLVIPTGGVPPVAVARRAAEIAPAVVATKGAKKTTWHKVKRGETLSEIADDYGVSMRNLLTWNSLGSANRIRAGQRLRISPPASSAVKRKPKAKDA